MSGNSSPQHAGKITLDELIALNEEMAALARAGIPLERGLVALGGDMPGRLGSIASSLGVRLESGESLERILARYGDSFPPAYRAAIEAGLRAGKLSVALEGVAKTLRRVAQLRRQVALALLYPLMLFAIAYALFVYTTVSWSSTIGEAYGGLQLPGNVPLDVLSWLGATAIWWAPWPPLLLVLALIVGWLRSRRTATGAGRVWWKRIASPGRLLAAGRLATFAEVVALLVEQRVPFDEAVVLAAEAAGDKPMQREARDLAERLRRGESPANAAQNASGIPPLLAWRIACGARHGDLAGPLRQAADHYNRHANRMADTLAIALPLLLTTVIGGTATAVYATAVLAPWATVLIQLATRA